MSDLCQTSQKQKDATYGCHEWAEAKRNGQTIPDQELNLTELEGALIAKNIIFQKIYQLPKSRWTALKDRVINVPIEDEAIINTLQQMPRTPKEAGLIGVALKRKEEYKNTHCQQLINPDKLFKMLEKLKTSKNPHYQFYEDYNMYQDRCKRTDPTGFNVVFQDEDIIDEIVDIADKTDFVVNSGPDSDEGKENDEVEHKVFKLPSETDVQEFPQMRTCESRDIDVADIYVKVPIKT